MSMLIQMGGGVTQLYGGRQCTHHSIPWDAMRTRVASPDQNHSLPGPDQTKKEPGVETFWNVTENGSTWELIICYFHSESQLLAQKHPHR